MHTAPLLHRHMHWYRLCVLLLLPFALLLVACAATPSTTHAGCSTTGSLQGAGSTFDAPLFNKLFTVYSTVPCGLTVYYYAVGSGTGTAQLLNQLVDFGATDAPLTDRQLAASPNGTILHVPVTLGVVAISYHLTGVSGPLKLNGPVLAAIYLGTITNWDDPAITQLNAGVSLPHRTIHVIHRSDGSGTTAIFTHYLAEISPLWKTQVGTSTTVSWPTGQGEQGNEGVAETIGSTEGALGYVEFSYVVSHHLTAALVENSARTFLAPSIAGAQAAAASFQTIPTDLRFYVVNAPGANAYPIAGYSWVIVYRHQRDAEKGKALAQLLWWMILPGTTVRRAPRLFALACSYRDQGRGTDSRNAVWCQFDTLLHLVTGLHARRSSERPFPWCNRQPVAGEIGV